ncbi:MAG: hypothetical protein MHPSP_004119, partial [Paramarteilia canceri]
MSHASQQQCLYDVLGVQSDCSQKEIENSFKKLARKWHPDRAKDEEEKEKFAEVFV